MIDEHELFFSFIFFKKNFLGEYISLSCTDRRYACDVFGFIEQCQRLHAYSVCVFMSFMIPGLIPTLCLLFYIKVNLQVAILLYLLGSWVMPLPTWYLRGFLLGVRLGKRVLLSLLK